MFFRKDSVARSQIREHHGVEEETVVIETDDGEEVVGYQEDMFVE